MNPARIRSSPPASNGRVVAVVAAGLLVFGAALAAQLVGELRAAPGVLGHHDFLAFWSAGRLVLEGHPGDLYDAAALTAIQRGVIPVPIGVNGYMPFINPPAAAVLMAPLATLAEPTARIVWVILNGIVVLAAALWITRGMTSRERLIGTALIATSYPAYHALAEGQWSIVLLGAGLVALEAARHGAWVRTGGAVGILWLKPQFVALPLLFLVFGRRWAAAASALAVGAVATAIALPLTGFEPNLTYAGYLVGVVTSHFSGAGAAGAAVWRGDLATTEGINGLLVGWLGQDQTGIVTTFWAVAVFGLGMMYLAAVRSDRPGLESPRARVMLAAAIALVMLVNPNQFVQDCVLIFLVLEVLAPLPPTRRFATTVLTVALADLTFLDLRAPAVHLFPIVLIVGVVVACRPSMVPARARAWFEVP